MQDSHCISLPSKRDTEIAQRSLLSRSQRHYAEAIKQRVIIAEAIGEMPPVETLRGKNEEKKKEASGGNASRESGE